VDIAKPAMTQLEAMRKRALALVALCVGGMVLARNVGDPDLANDFRRMRMRRC
jgi:hypothetical protein